MKAKLSTGATGAPGSGFHSTIKNQQSTIGFLISAQEEGS
jgi:hypothetical protein